VRDRATGAAKAMMTQLEALDETLGGGRRSIANLAQSRPLGH
jgi:hypothetical protein